MNVMSWMWFADTYIAEECDTPTSSAHLAIDKFPEPWTLYGCMTHAPNTGPWPYILDCQQQVCKDQHPTYW